MGVVEVYIGIVGHELRIASTVWGEQRYQYQRRGRRLSDGDPITGNVGRKLTGGQILARLGQNEIRIRIRLDIEIYHQRGLRVAGGV